MNLPDATIFDVDGTLCDVTSIRHLILPSHPEYPGYRDFDHFHKASLWCPPIERVAAAARKLHAEGGIVLVVTGRGAQYRDLTTAWLASNGIVYREIHFRPFGDGRPDNVVKREILRDLRTRYHIVEAWDDNPSIIALWREEGIPVNEIPGWYDPEEWVAPE